MSGSGRHAEGRRGSDYMQRTAGYPEGVRPTLGLARYNDHDLTVDRGNPFRVHNDTEKLLIVRERERQFHGLHRHEAEAMRV